ncbi:MAG: LysR family transcriptional regulator [Mesorhizobium sp.]|nr:MAG: LysR family transcriptional regulator [Mesorhizobium sp.]
MDLRKLLYMKSVVDHGSFNKAAKELHISQPALSRSIDKLEASLGVKLLERSPVGVVPTPDGELLYSRAWFIQDEIDIAEKQIQSQREVRPQRIVIGVMGSIVANVLPLAVARWRKEFPDVPLRIEQSSHTELFLFLLRTNLDFIIAHTGGFELALGLKQRVLFRDRKVVFTRAGHPAHDGPVSWKELSKYPWATHLIRNQASPVEQVMEAEGICAPTQLTECNSVSFMKTLVANSDHIGMLYNHLVKDEVDAGLLQRLPITAPLLGRNIAVFSRERSSFNEASCRLLDHIAEIGALRCRTKGPSTH